MPLHPNKKWKAYIPTPEELIELSQLYNTRRQLKLKEADLRRQLMVPINEQLQRAEEHIKSKFGKPKESVRLRIIELKTKFRMRQEWDLYR